MALARLLYTATAMLWAVQIGKAAPSPSSKAIGGLIKRADVRFEDCGDDNDDKRQKAGKAWSEAANLASMTITGTLDDGTSFQNTNAYKHYFEDADATQVQAMFSSIQAGSSDDSSNALQLKFIISCKATESCDEQTLAVTDSDPSTDTFTPIIRLCPAFFTHDLTKNTLESKEFKRNPRRRDNSWCQPDQPFKDFETAGLTFLHEMTHLNQLGVAAGLTERATSTGNIRTHGTDDIYLIADNYDASNPARAARKLKDNWTRYERDNNNEKPKLLRVENAESYAAAALEFWFQKYCGWTTIQE